MGSDAYAHVSALGGTQRVSCERRRHATRRRGGIKSATLNIQGEYAYGYLKAESGVHRLVRISPFDANKRRHTSFASVFVSPEIEDDVEIEIKDSDLRIDRFRSTGAGGQGVNTTDSAVRIIHKPTGLMVYCADGRSQIKNKASAMSVLRSRLLQAEQEKERAKYAAQRRSQIGTGDRSERIRTYNFPQSRCTDHRIGFTLHSLPQIMEGNLDPLIAELQRVDFEERFAALTGQPVAARRRDEEEED